jgi:hypothetical protein
MILAALALPITIGIAALAVEGTLWCADHHQMRNMADAERQRNLGGQLRRPGPAGERRRRSATGGLKMTPFSCLRDSRGNVAIEFALMLPVFIVVLMGLADYGRAMTARSELDSAARAGLQVLLRDITDTAGAISAAETSAPEADATANIVCVCPNGATVACSPGTCPTGVPKRTATVTVTRTQPLLMPWPSFDDPLLLQAKAVGRLR